MSLQNQSISPLDDAVFEIISADFIVFQFVIHTCLYVYIQKYSSSIFVSKKKKEGCVNRKKFNTYSLSLSGN